MPESRPPSPQALQSAMLEAAGACSKILMRHFGRILEVSEKKDAGLVTKVDLASEKAAMKVLRKARPDFDFLTEETNPEEKKSQAGQGARGRWIIDPLDGTTNYIHGFPMFCISLAAEWEGRIVTGVIHAPALGDTYTAIAGKGARVNGKRLRVSRTRKLRDSLLTTGFTYRKHTFLHREMEAFERLSGIARAIRRPGSAALDLAYVARGVFDGFWERRLSPWDVAAGMLLVNEAGGKVTDFQGLPFDVRSPEILASNSLLHDELRQSVAPECCPI